MGNDIADHRAAIGLLYCQINGISHKHEFLSPFVSGMKRYIKTTDSNIVIGYLII
jgi:hypothetical protein